MSLARFLVAFALLVSLGSACPAATPTEQVADKVISCFKAGNNTIPAMYACSGVWVTPRILTLCFLEADCPVIPDSIDAQAVVAAAVGGKEKLQEKLSIDLSNVLAMPSRAIIEECRKAAGDDKAFEVCVAQKMPSPAIASVLACASAQGDKERALCLTKNSPKEVATIIECVAGKGTSTASLQECSKVQAWNKVQAVKSCISDVTAENGKVDCLVTGLPPAQKELAKCLAASANRSDAAVACLGKLNPAAAAKVDEIACAAKAGSDGAALAACFSKSLKGDAAKLAACAGAEQSKLISCIAGSRPEYKAASEIVACAQGGRDAAALVANCSGILIKDEKTRVALACAIGCPEGAVFISVLRF